MATLDQAIEQFYGAGMPSLPHGLALTDGRLHRYGPHKRAYYKLYEYLARNGARYISGYFGMWGSIDLTKVRADFTGIEPDELARLRRAQADTEVLEKQKRLQRSRFAANRARQQWDGARARLAEGETCAYLVRKGVAQEKGLRYLTDGTLLVPLVRYDVTEEQEEDANYVGPRRLVGLQKIAPDGSKLFNKGAAVEGAAFRAGKKPKDGELLLVGEGLATVLSVHQALERAHTIFAAFFADNLLPVARILRALYPHSPILFLADDDAYLEARLNKALRDEYGVTQPYRVEEGERAFAGKRGAVVVRASFHDDPDGARVLAGGIEEEGVKPYAFVYTNAGRTKARAAATELGMAWVVWPVFGARALGPDPEAPKLTDFNDLAAAQSVDYVRLQVADAIKTIEDARVLSKALREGAPPKAQGDGGGKGGGDEPDWRLHGSLIERFTQIYPSDTAYDAEKGRVVKVEHMRLRFGTRAVSMWLGSPRKRVIDPEQIVFDPSRTADPEMTVNLFRGLPAQPEGNGSCALLLELVHYLCGEHHEDSEAPKTQWLLRWLAYPLQHVGAKMQTAVVMHGEEGTGKNLLFGVVRKFYGRHGGVITQRQLEDKFNTWQSAKLFVVANEVVTRQEMSHQGGYIRNLITEPEVQINPKFQDQREEANHMNLVFLANAMQPILLGSNDRRCFVIRTPNPRAEEFYTAVAAEVAAGGAAAFYRHLMALDLAEFNEHTKPPMTDAKRALIELGMTTPQIFWQELKDGLLGLPYGPALATDLYKAYQVWCFRNGYKMPEGMKFFSPNFMSMNGVRRVDRFVPAPGNKAELMLVGTETEATLRKRRVFLMGQPEADDMAEKLRISNGVTEFRNRLREYLREETVDTDGSARQGQGQYGQGAF